MSESKCDINLRNKMGDEADSIMQEFEQIRNQYEVNDVNAPLKINEILGEMRRRDKISKLQNAVMAQKRSERLTQIYRNTDGITDMDQLTTKLRKNFEQEMQNIGDRQGVIQDQAQTFLLHVSSNRAMKQLMKTPEFQLNVYRAIIHPDKWK